jgi:hypothetical protein
MSINSNNLLMIERLKDCFREDFPVHPGCEFSEWLLKSNNPKVGSIFKFLIQNNLAEDRHKDMLVQLENESLGEILDILLREPLADYFWYGYPEHGGKLSYSLPHHDVVPANSLRVDKEKIKIFLRDIKIEKLLQ